MEVTQKIYNLVEKLIKIRDLRCETWEERDAVAEACNTLEELAKFIKNFQE
jgi:hypothetical protein